LNLTIEPSGAVRFAHEEAAHCEKDSGQEVNLKDPKAPGAPGLEPSRKVDGGSNLI
jgi:hypothetical protein